MTEACVWYRIAAVPWQISDSILDVLARQKRRGLASSGCKDSETDMNWIDRFNFATASLGHLYFISLHWALTLFIGTMEVAWLGRSLRVDCFA